MRTTLSFGVGGGWVRVWFFCFRQEFLLFLGERVLVYFLSGKAVFILVSVDVNDSRILTSTSKFKLTPNWWASKKGSRSFFDVVKKSCRRRQKKLTPSPM